MRARPRLPIGRLRAADCRRPSPAMDARLDLWNAEVSGTAVHRPRAQLRVPQLRARRASRCWWSSWRRAAEPASARFVFQPRLPINERLLARSRSPSRRATSTPPPSSLERGARCGCRCSGAPAAANTRWPGRRSALAGGRRCWCSASPTRFRGQQRPRSRPRRPWTARCALGPDRLRRSHRAFWHAYYPQSFLSVPDAAAGELLLDPDVQAGLGHARRPPGHRHPGALVRRTPWPGIWWNLNIQLSYWPVYTANRLALGESLLALVDRNRDNLRNNVPAAVAAPTPWRWAASAAPTPCQPGRCTGPRGPRTGPHEMSQPGLGDAQLLAALPAHHGPGACCASGCSRCSRPA